MACVQACAYSRCVPHKARATAIRLQGAGQLAKGLLARVKDYDKVLDSNHHPCRPDNRNVED